MPKGECLLGNFVMGWEGSAASSEKCHNKCGRCFGEDVYKCRSLAVSRGYITLVLVDGLVVRAMEVFHEDCSYEMIG